MSLPDPAKGGQPPAGSGDAGIDIDRLIAAQLEDGQEVADAQRAAAEAHAEYSQALEEARLRQEELDARLRELTTVEERVAVLESARAAATKAHEAIASEPSRT